MLLNKTTQDTRKDYTHTMTKLFSKFIAGIFPVSSSLFIFIISIRLILGADSNVCVTTTRIEWDLDMRRVDDDISDTAGETALRSDTTDYVDGSLMPADIQSGTSVCGARHADARF